MFEIRVLGPVEVRDGDRAVPLGGARQRGVLTLLVVSAGAVVPTDRLADRLWSGDPPPSATVTLQGYVARLRRALAGAEGVAIETRGSGYALVVTDPDVLDARRFERLLAEGQEHLAAGRADAARALLCEALGLWRGPALADLLEEPYAAAEAARLEELRLTALEARAEADLVLGRHAAVVAELEALVNEHPLREGVRAQLMRALHGSGRTAEALRVYAAGRKALVEELGIEPGTVLQRLEQAILLQDPAVEPAPPSAPPPPAPTAPVPVPVAAPGPAPLPVPLTSFVGREREVREVLAALDRSRLVTLLGPGGTGKTRLSLEVAAELQAADAEVALVELAGLAEPYLVPGAVAGTLGVHDEPDRTLLEGLVEALDDRPIVLVLDNCEHLLRATADLAAPLLRGCPRLRILATSRAVLGVPGEVAWPVPALPVPPAGEVTLAQALEAAAVRLFVERARAANPRLELTDADAPLAVAICRRLDGMPLALELAAARLRVLSLDQVATRLGDRFRLLTGGSSTLEPRQRTLRAAVDWSYDLLRESERLVFQRLSVFPGSFGLDAAEVVCADDRVDALDVLDLLDDLVSKSLVTRLPDGAGEARFRLLESLRDYAAGRLAEGPDGREVCRRHAELVVHRVEEAASRLESPERRQWLDRLAGLADDARLALDTVLDRREAEPALRLTAALWRFWDHRYELSEGRSWLQRALALHGGPDTARVEALLGAAKLALVDDDHDEAAAACDEGLALAERTGDDRHRARLLVVLAEVLRSSADSDEAEARADEALQLTESVGDRWWQADATRVRALLALDRGEVERTTGLATACLELSSAAGDVEGSAGARFMLSGLAREAGDLDRAVELCEGSLADFRRASDPWGTAQAVHALGRLAVLRSDAELGRRLGEESLRLHDELGNMRGLALSYQLLGEAALEQGDLEHADVLLGEALGRLRERGFALDSAEAEWRVGEVALRRGDLARALRLARSGLAPYRTGGRRRNAVRGLALLAVVQARRGEAAAALSAGEEALSLATEAGDDLGAARALDAVAEAALAAGDAQRAARTLSAAAMTRRVAGARLTAREEAEERVLVEAVRARLADTPLARQWAAEWPPEVIDLRDPLQRGQGSDVAPGPAVDPGGASERPR